MNIIQEKEINYYYYYYYYNTSLTDTKEDTSLTDTKEKGPLHQKLERIIVNQQSERKQQKTLLTSTMTELESRPNRKVETVKYFQK